MKVAVLVKQIPDPTGAGRLDASRRLLREGVEAVLDPGDAYGVEAALRVAEATSGEVVAISMGPERAAEAVRKAMAMGAAEGVLVSDERLLGSDALATARVLAAAVAQVAPDLLIAATESTDGYSGTVPQSVAELLGWPALTFAKHLEVEGSTITIQRQTQGGHDLVAAEVPAVVTVTGGINQPRYPTLKGIMAARGKPLQQPTLEELGIEPPSVGEEGARQRVASVEPAAARSRGEVVEAGEGVAQRLADYLSELKLI